MALGFKFHSLYGRLFGLDAKNGDVFGQTAAGKFEPVARGPQNRVQTFTTTPQTLVAEDNFEKTIVLDRAAGITVTLPALLATGSGKKVRFFVKTTASGGNYVIQVANATDIIQGVIIQRGDDAASLGGFITTGTSDTITLNGGTQGGFAGDFLELQDVGANIWAVRGSTQATGAEATPFSAAV